MKRNEDVSAIVIRLISRIRELPDGSWTTTARLLLDLGLDPEELQDSLFDIHFALFKAAEEEEIFLDMSSHDGLVEGLPYNLDFQIFHNAKTYWYCGVVFKDDSYPYAYISDMGYIDEGSFVKVPFGTNNELRIGTVDTCSPFMEKDAPYPVEKTKHIVRIVEWEDPDDDPGSNVISPIPVFSKYLELIFANDDLWENFQTYVRMSGPYRGDEFFEYHRDPECIKIWRQMLENMGGGFPLTLFASAAFLLLAYKEQGHDLTRNWRAYTRKRWSETMKNRRIKKCPKCGSDRVAPILYGLPVFGEDLKRKIESEEIYLGGCCVGNADPQFHCFACKKDIGTPPILQSSHGVEDFRDIVTSVQFSDGGYFGGFDEVFFQKTQDGIKVSITPSFLGKRKLPIEREVSEEEWETLLDKLFCRLYIHEWKKTYNDYTVCDGEQWSLELRLIGNRQRNYQGSNAFPPYWSSLKRVFKPYLDECPLLEEE